MFPSTSKQKSAKSDADQVLDSFIKESPATHYTFDSERDAPESEICREAGVNKRECMMLQMHSKRLFEAMQERGFFCVLPNEPSQTYMECRPLTKS